MQYSDIIRHAQDITPAQAEQIDTILGQPNEEEEQPLTLTHAIIYATAKMMHRGFDPLQLLDLSDDDLSEVSIQYDINEFDLIALKELIA
jgi:hypothetical protein